MDLNQEFELQDCPICGGPAILEEENGWCCYVACMDCGAHTVSIDFNDEAAQRDAAQRAARLWNIGKVLKETTSE